ncbi:MAG TPA: hypothetical protein VFH91_07590, partial [Pyrinomonadaceae bacterium]|nr:hypothetical protein [Pyrinomonadaceae bacterium]
KARALKLIERIENPAVRVELMSGESAIGGGAGPTSMIKTSLLAISHDSFGAQEILNSLRTSNPPVIARISADKVLLDLRTVLEEQEELLLLALNLLLRQEKL